MSSYPYAAITFAGAWDPHSELGDGDDDPDFGPDPPADQSWEAINAAMLEEDAEAEYVAECALYQVCPECGADLTDPANGAGGWHICDGGPLPDEDPF